MIQCIAQVRIGLAVGRVFNVQSKRYEDLERQRYLLSHVERSSSQSLFKSSSYSVSRSLDFTATFCRCPSSMSWHTSSAVPCCRSILGNGWCGQIYTSVPRIPADPPLPFPKQRSVGWKESRVIGGKAWRWATESGRHGPDYPFFCRCHALRSSPRARWRSLRIYHRKLILKLTVVLTREKPDPLG